MAMDETRGRTAIFIERAKALFTRPKETWPEIHRDMTPSGELFTRYAAPLAALAPVVGLLTGHVFGWSPFGFRFFGQLFTAVAGYGFTMANLLIMSFIASRLAPRFGGEGSPRDAFKLIVYSSTAAWIASAVAMLPGLEFVGFASFFSLYLYFQGIVPMMRVPEENKKRFGFVTIACAIALNMVTMGIANAPAMMFGGSQAPADQYAWKDGDFDGHALRDFGREIRDAMRKGKVDAVSSADLQALLPTKIGDFERTGVQSVNGPAGSHAIGTYEHGDKEFTLKVVDMAGFGAMAQMGAAFRIEKNQQDEDGFERISNKDGTFTVEKWDNGDDEGRYATMVDKRFLIEAKGEADTFDALKQAAGSVDNGKLIALEKK